MQTVTAVPGSAHPGRLGRRGIRLLTAATVARLADEAAGVGVVLYVIARTADPRLAGLVVSAFALPTLVTGPVLGAVLDRLRRKRVLFLANQLVLAAALIGVLLLAGRAPGGALIGLGLLAGSTAPLLTGGFSSLVPLVVPAAALPRANAADSASYNVAGLAGPALVAAVAGSAGAGAALAGTAGLAAAAVLLVLAAPTGPRRPAPGPAPATDGPAPATDGPAPATDGPAPATDGAPPAGAAGRERLGPALVDGVRLLVRAPLLRAATIATTVAHAVSGLLPVTVPLLAIQLGQPAARGGWLLTALSAGALAGALVSARLLRRFTPAGVLMAALVGYGLSLTAVAGAPSLAVALPLAVLAGLCDGPVFAATLAIRQSSVPPHRYAQLAATAASVKTGGYALGAASTGVLAAHLSARQLILVVAAGQLVALLPFAPLGRRRAVVPTDRAVLTDPAVPTDPAVETDPGGPTAPRLPAGPVSGPGGGRRAAVGCGRPPR
ncbi:MFS transporter [Plantactinospora siamensis]|uniref:MFS transporter n=1 Tax=Plantactinospora siamensis TaxID=555372 RepID=A0ABV6NUY4_9ACTN